MSTNAFVSTRPDPIGIRPHRAIGEIVFDAIFEESHEDGLTITNHPVEQGAEISDHAVVSARRVTIRGGVSDSGGSIVDFSGARRSQEVYDKLLELMRSRQPFNIVTGKQIYKNMLVETLSTVTNAERENAAAFDVVCREVIIVETRTTTVPPRSRHVEPNKTGATTDAGTKQVTTQEHESISAAAKGDPKYKRPEGAAW